MQQSEHEFYVYVLARPNSKAFYVGKGKGPRVFKHEDEARSGHKCHKCNVIRKIWRNGGEVQRYIVLTTNDEQEAFAYEQTLIRLFGRSGLANLTDGGEGASGVIHSPAFRERQREIATAQWQDPEFRAKQDATWNEARRISASDKSQTNWQDPAIRTRRIAGIKQTLTSPEMRALWRSVGKAKWEDPAYRAHLDQLRNTPEFRANMSTTITAKWQEPEYREKITASLRASKQDPGFRARMSATKKAQWQDAEYRANVTAARNTPEYRAKASARAKALWQDPEYRAAHERKRKEGES